MLLLPAIKRNTLNSNPLSVALSCHLDDCKEERSLVATLTRDDKAARNNHSTVMLEQSDASKIPKPVISTTIRRKDLKNNRQSSATHTVRGGGASKASDGGEKNLITGT